MKLQPRIFNLIKLTAVVVTFISCTHAAQNASTDDENATEQTTAAGTHPDSDAVADLPPDAPDTSTTAVEAPKYHPVAQHHWQRANPVKVAAQTEESQATPPEPPAPARTINPQSIPNENMPETAAPAGVGKAANADLDISDNNNNRLWLYFGGAVVFFAALFVIIRKRSMT